MSKPFDPYHRWLGIPPHQQPADHYRLLGVTRFESDPDVISNAADSRMGHLRKFQAGRNSESSQRLLNEVAAAKVCLLNPDKKAAYDESLRNGPAAEGTKPPPLPPSQPAPQESLRVTAAGGGVVQDHLARRQRQQAASMIGFAVIGLLVVVALVVFWQSRSEQPPLEVAGETSPGDPAPADVLEESPSAVHDPQPIEEKPVAPGSASPEADAASKPRAEEKPLDPPPPEPVGKPPVEEPAKPEPKPAPPQRLPVPSDAVQAGIARQVDELFHVGQTRLPSESVQLAGELIDEAAKPTAVPAERFVLLRKAMELATVGGDASLVLAAAERMEAGFQVDALAVKQSALREFADQANDSVRRKSFVVASLAVIAEAAAAGRYDVALALAADAGKFCQLPPPIDGREQIAAWHQQLPQLARQQSQFQQAKRVLEAAPDDPAANLTAGRWLCLVRNDWGHGLPHLAKGDDASLAQLARREASPPTDWEARVELGDAWWEVADRAGAADTGALRGRAAYWYLAAWPETSGLNRATLKKRLGEVPSQLAATGLAAELAVQIYTALLQDAALSATERQAAESELARWQGLANPDTTDRGQRPGPAAGPREANQQLDALLAEAATLIGAGHHDEARKKLLEAIRLDPDDIRATFAIGLVEALGERDFSAAEKRFADCARRQPGHVPSLNNAALVRLRLNRERQAIRDWELATAAQPTASEIAHNLGRCRRLAQDKRLSIDATALKSLEELSERVAGPSRSSTGWLYMACSADAAQPTGWPQGSSLEDRICMTCTGKGYVSCPNRACRRGRVQRMETRVVGRNPVTGAKITQSVAVPVPCGVCRGQGRVPCPHCTNGIEKGL